MYVWSLRTHEFILLLTILPKKSILIISVHGTRIESL